jgi:hypothetical protein
LDKILIFEAKNFKEALEVTYCCFYVFNKHYPNEAKKSFEFIQRMFGNYDIEFPRAIGLSTISLTAIRKAYIKLKD